MTKTIKFLNVHFFVRGKVNKNGVKPILALVQLVQYSRTLYPPALI
jgi:hypothetical protein